MVPAAVLALVHEVLCISPWLSAALFYTLLLAWSRGCPIRKTSSELMGMDFLV